MRAQEDLLKEVRISDLQAEKSDLLAQNRELRREKAMMPQRGVHICLLILFDWRPCPSLTVR